MQNYQLTVEVIHALRQTCSRNNKNSSFFLFPFFHCDTFITWSKTRSEVHLTNVAPLSLIHLGLVITWELLTVARSAVKRNNWCKSVLVKFPPVPCSQTVKWKQVNSVSNIFILLCRRHGWIHQSFGDPWRPHKASHNDANGRAETSAWN